MLFIKSNRLSGSSIIDPRLTADALLTQMSMPPKRSTARATAHSIASPSRISPTMGNACPPASSISRAAVKTVPGSLGFGSAVLAIRATLAPSFAARLAIARPTPRLAPDMNIVLPLRDIEPQYPARWDDLFWASHGRDRSECPCRDAEGVPDR